MLVSCNVRSFWSDILRRTSIATRRFFTSNVVGRWLCKKTGNVRLSKISLSLTQIGPSTDPAAIRSSLMELCRACKHHCPNGDVVRSRCPKLVVWIRRRFKANKAAIRGRRCFCVFGSFMRLAMVAKTFSESELSQVARGTLSLDSTSQTQQDFESRYSALSSQISESAPTLAHANRPIAAYSEHWSPSDSLG